MATQEQFGVSATGTPLRWNVFLPDPAIFPAPWNVICVWHGGGWAHGNRTWEAGVSADYATAGIAAVTCDYELTIDLLPGQADPVLWPNQAPDCVIAILAARSPDAASVLFGKVTGKVGTHGGSAGATLAMDTSLAGTVGADRCDACCALSANYDFSDQDSLDQYESQGEWISEVMIYNDVPDRTFTTQLYAHSVLPLALAADPDDIPPLFMVQSNGDAIGPPTSQMAQMVDALQTIGFSNYTAALVGGNGHAKDNWNVTNPATGNPIKVDVIDFFKTAFLDDGGGGGGGGGGPTSGFRLTLTGGTYSIVGSFLGGVLPEGVRTANIVDLQGTASPGRLYNASLVHFSPEGDSEPALTTFRVIDGVRKELPCGAYKLLSSPGNDWWSGFDETDPVIDYPYVKGYRGRTGMDLIMPGDIFVYDFSGPDLAEGIMAAHAKKLSLGVGVGISATDAWYDIGGPDEVARIAIDLADITPQAYQPVMWDPNHLEKMRQFVNDLGEKYDSDMNIPYFVVSGFMKGFQANTSGTAIDDAKWDQAALDFGYSSKKDAWIFAGQTIIGYFIDAFPNTPLYFSSGAQVWFVNDGTANDLRDWITTSTNNKCGLMTTGLRATEGPHNDPIVSPYPNGSQAISQSTDESRFYVQPPPDPYPVAPQLVDDLMLEAAAQGRTFVEIYPVDINDPDNEGVITINNQILCSIRPEI